MIAPTPPAVGPLGRRLPSPGRLRRPRAMGEGPRDGDGGCRQCRRCPGPLVARLRHLPRRPPVVVGRIGPRSIGRGRVWRLLDPDGRSVRGPGVSGARGSGAPGLGSKQPAGYPMPSRSSLEPGPRAARIQNLSPGLNGSKVRGMGSSDPESDPRCTRIQSLDHGSRGAKVSTMGRSDPGNAQFLDVDLRIPGPRSWIRSERIFSGFGRTYRSGR